MPNSFTEVRFDPGIVPRGKGNLIYKTTIIRTNRDFEKRNVNQEEYLFEGDIGEILLNANQVAYLITFFNARKGKAEGFRYKYWGDYTATHQPLQLNPKIICSHIEPPPQPTETLNTYTQGVITQFVENGSTTYKLQKKYVDAGDVTYKTITKPVEGTVNVYVDSNLQSGIAIDYTTGYVSGVSSSNATWSGEFDLPVWFDVDALPGVQIFHSDGNYVWGTEKEELFRFDSLPIVELPIKIQMSTTT